MSIETATRDTREDYNERVLRVLVHIQQHLDDEDLSLDQLASIAYFSPFHFHRIFRALVGEPVKQHVRRLRLERAAHHLKHTSRPVVTIALEARYETHESFTRAFHGSFGCSPTDFRRATNRPARIASASHVHYVDQTRGPTLSPIPRRSDTMNADVKVLDPMHIAFLRHVGPYDRVGETWERLTDWIGQECHFGPSTRFFGLCWDDPEVTAPENIRYDACVTLDADVEPSGEIGITTLAGGRYAVTLHEGGYDRLNETYSELLGAWFPDHGHEPGEPPSLEFYLNDPDSTDPEDLLTEVCMPIDVGR